MLRRKRWKRQPYSKACENVLWADDRRSAEIATDIVRSHAMSDDKMRETAVDVLKSLLDGSELSENFEIVSQIPRIAREWWNMEQKNAASKSSPFCLSDVLTYENREAALSGFTDKLLDLTANTDMREAIRIAIREGEPDSDKAETLAEMEQAMKDEILSAMQNFYKDTHESSAAKIAEAICAASETEMDSEAVGEYVKGLLHTRIGFGGSDPCIYSDCPGDTKFPPDYYQIGLDIMLMVEVRNRDSKT